VGEITVRLATADDAFGISKVKIDTWRSAYKHILDPAVLQGMSLKRDSARWKERLRKADEHDRCFVACDGDKIVGFLYVGPNRFDEFDCDAELQAIYVHPSMHRRGVGKRMLGPAVEFLVGAGFQSMVVVVFRDNPLGTSFYKSMGAKFHDAGTLEIGGKSYADESYVWENLLDLQSELRK
jgi:ribosomal protein S18 acetylase RimI-like enzyme